MDNYHHHARLTIVRREELAKRVLAGRLSLKEAEAEFKLSRQSAAKWVRRYREQGVSELRDRSSRPHRSPRGTIEGPRRQRWTGVRIAQQPVEAEPHPRSGTETATNRYEHAAPGDLLHLDIKRLVRIQRPSHRVTGNRRDGVKGIGAEFLHIAIDDHSRLAFTAVDPDQTERSSIHFLAAAVAWYGQFGIAIRRVLTDNGPCYKANRFAHACNQLELKRRRTRPYTPRTNGKAERFIKTAINEWAYARTYQNSQERTSSLPAWPHQYNWHRPHASLNQLPPIT